MFAEQDYLDDLFAFISQSPTACHAAASGAALLDAHGFTRLFETDHWGELKAGSYYLVRDDASLIAWTLTGPADAARPLRLGGAHTDSPALKVKPNPVQLRHGCVQLGVEVYGGALLNPWFDRDLSLAGRVVWQQADGVLQASLIDFRRPVACIPSLAIHLDREVNDKRAIDRQTGLVPLFMQANGEPPDFRAILGEQLAAEHPDTAGAAILDWDLFLYDPQPPARVGLRGEFISGPRLDNLVSCHALLRALGQTAERRDSLIVLNDHEEVGSLSASGAQGTFLRDLLSRLYPDPVLRRQVLAGSLLVSVDNAHAVHPNFAGRHDPEHLPLLNGGPVIKMNAAGRYATSGPTAALFRTFCRQAGVPCQQFVMRNDLACGSTIGPLTAAGLGVAAVDVGIPQLAMHSIRETAGSSDGWSLLRALAAFLSAPDEGIRCPAARP
jgi:aspartyl aminopeptidase